jgi:hypothetical protein
LSRILYKTVCEVKVYHEYYLTNHQGHTIFESALQEDRLEFLLQQFSDGFPSVNNDLEFRIPAQYATVMEGHHIKILTTYSGFRLAAESTQILPQDLSIPILLYQKDDSFGQVNGFLRNKNIPAKYFFSNISTASDKIFPVLSKPINPVVVGSGYEQGDLAIHPGNDLRQYYFDGVADQWQAVQGAGFANPNDRVLVPLKFRYCFAETDLVSQAQVLLKNLSNTVIGSFDYSAGQPFREINLDFSKIPSLSVLPEKNVPQQFQYFLEISGNNNYSKTYPLIFYTDASELNHCYGLVLLQARSSDPAYDLISNNSFRDPFPVFEIRIKSPTSFWRYLHDKGRKLKLMDDTDDFLIAENGQLISKTPHPTSYTFQGPLPNPLPDEFIRMENRRLFSNIYVPESKRFPLDPAV